VQWRAEALADLQQYYDWLKTGEGANAARVVRRIRVAANSMRRLGDIGRPGGKPGTRELSVRNAPYVIVYRVDADIADILAVYHAAQDR
jgi:toxin ParE1/3/4